MLAACGGGGNDAPVVVPDITQQQAYIKASNTGPVDAFGTSIALSGDGNTLAIGAPFEASAATDVGGIQNDDTAPGAGAVYVFTRNAIGVWSQQAYIKASNTGAGDGFGTSVALSADGNTLAVGAPFEASAATVIGGNQANDSAADAGAVYVFTRNTIGVWTQQAYIKASNAEAGDQFGVSLALSGDGKTLAVGAPIEASAATGVGGVQADNTAFSAGAVYVFTRPGANWIQQAYVKASNTEAGDQFGGTVALSSDGGTLAVGAQGEDSAATGVGGVQADINAINAGAVYVFTRSAIGVWTQQAYIKASNTGTGDNFGSSLALSSDGGTLAVGAQGEDSVATGIDGIQGNNTASSAGAVYVFTRTGVAWMQQAYIKASNTGTGDNFGSSIALSSNGAALAVGARNEDSAAIGIGGNQASDAAANAGAVYFFNRSGVIWTQQAYVKTSNTGAGDEFGNSIALSGDGNTLAVGANGEASAATGVGGNQADNTAVNAGAVYEFQ